MNLMAFNYMYQNPKRQLTLGQMLAKLEDINEKWYHVVFNFGNMVPGYFSSYRGIYAHADLDFDMPYSNGNYTPQVDGNAMIDRVKDCIGSIQCGWKGGEYGMHEDTPVWVALGGTSPDSYISDVVLSGARIYLIVRSVIQDESEH